MSKDIRSFFQKASKNSDRQHESVETKTKKRSHRVIESDDEDDELDTLKKKHLESKKISKSKNQTKKTEVIVQVENFFEKVPITQKKETSSRKTNASTSQTTPKKQSTAKKKSKNKNADASDFAFEIDDELEASLLSTNDEELVSGLVSPKQNLKVSEPPKEPSLQERVGNSNEDCKKKPTPKKLSVSSKDEKTVSKPEVSSEQKKRNAEAYQKYLSRGGPKNPGSKEIPEGSPTCLQGLNFVITGVLDSLEREEAVELIKKCGGQVTSQISKKTSYVIVGEEPGVSKIQKANTLGTKKITEDDLLNLIRDNTKSVKKEVTVKSPKKPVNIKTKEKVCVIDIEPTCNDINLKIENSGDMLLADKYKPKSTKNIVGQNGDKSCVKKLIKWLENWDKNHSSTAKKKSARPAPWAQSDDGSYYKAALLSGPPGVGKTTTAHLVCKELGFDVIEFNASDTRSKRLLQEEVGELLSSKSIRGYFKDSGEICKKHALVMDEVDGMAGNEDRGGIQELILLIKNTKVPIIAICNDRNHMKMRSLVNYCFDLRFQKPRMEQIKGAMRSVCFKEKIDISGEALEELITASTHDLRQILFNLTVVASSHKTFTAEDAKKKGVEMKKPLNLGPWDVVRKVFSASEHQKMNFSDKADLFFQDYSLGPLFVYESYLRVKPHKARSSKKKELELISKAAESLALGDVFEKTIRSQNAWTLLPVQAVFSSVLPGHYMSGHLQGQIQFPMWLGKNSKRNKFDRMLKDLHSSLKISITGTKEAINMDYLYLLKDSIVRPLVMKGSQGVQESLKFMLDYRLTKEDLDDIGELSSWPGKKDQFMEIESKVKAALTRALNKEGGAISHKAKKPARSTQNDEFDVEEEEEEVENEEDDNVESDPMIKKGSKKRSLKEENPRKGKKKKTDG